MSLLVAGCGLCASKAVFSVGVPATSACSERWLRGLSHQKVILGHSKLNQRAILPANFLMYLVDHESQIPAKAMMTIPHGFLTDRSCSAVARLAVVVRVG